MITRKSDAVEKRKVGVLMRVYGGGPAGMVYQETRKGHSEEFYHTKSTFMYYVIAGKGWWVINGRRHAVKAGDVVVVKPGNRFYYKGNLKQLLVTVPPWEARYEHKVRDVRL